MKDRTVRHVAFGKYFGFPECCVKAFVDFSRNYPGKPYADTVGSGLFKGTGYVPCEECKSLSEVLIRETITKNRKCPVPFPETCGIKEDLQRCLDLGYVSQDEYEKLLRREI